MEGLLQMRSIPYFDELSPEGQAQRRQEVYSGLLSVPKYGAMMLPASGVTEMMGLMADPEGEGYLPSTMDLLREGRFGDVGYQLLGGLGDALYAGATVLPPLAIPATSAKAVRASKLAESKKPKPLLKEEKDPLGYSKISFPDYASNTEFETVIDYELAPKNILSIEDLQGSLLFPLMGDQSATGRLLTKIDDIEFDSPVSLQGGYGFMRGKAAQSEDSAVWASGQGVISDVKNRVQQASEELGLPVNMIYTAMGKDAIDFATFPAEALAAQIPYSKISIKDKLDFDKIMKEGGVVRGFDKDKPYTGDPDWVGLDSPNLQEYLGKQSTPSKVRKAFVRLMDTQKALKAGFPHVGKTRYAVTDAELRDSLAGETGRSIARMDLENPIIDNPLYPHSTYDTQLRGEYIGGLLAPQPKEVIFRDFYNSLEGVKTKSGLLQSPSMKDYKFRLDLPMQYVDQELVDTIMSRSLLSE